MAFAVNDVVYLSPALVKANSLATDGSRYGRVIKLNPNGQNATYLVRMANNPMGNFIFDEASLTAVTDTASIYNPFLPPRV